MAPPHIAASLSRWWKSSRAAFFSGLISPSPEVHGTGCLVLVSWMLSEVMMKFLAVKIAAAWYAVHNNSHYVEKQTP